MSIPKTILLTRLMVVCTWCLLIISCEKKKDEDDPTPPPLTGTVTDIDGNVYPTVTIGSQVWMAANLNTTHYRNGDTIHHVADGTEWYNMTTEAYCVYENQSSNSAAYGKMYNWHAVNTTLLCPDGWHVPSDAEWEILENFLGEPATAGGKLKETGTAHWQSPNTGATNETGFSARPGGYRSSTGGFFSLTYNGYWWSSTEGSDPAYGLYRWLDFNLSQFYRNEDYKVDGISVRCVKD